MAKLSERQKKEISTHFKFSRADKELILKWKNDWEKDALNPLKKRIRKHYLNEQGRLCCFCKLPFRDIVYIEHTVPKKGKWGREEFTFESKNLSVACYHCNTKKSTNNDLVNWQMYPYPNAGVYLKIIHPHYDKYFNNIEIVDRSRYVPKSVKGYKTIERCKLYESTITDFLVKSMRYEDDPLIQGVLRFRDLQTDYKQKIDRFFNFFL